MNVGKFVFWATILSTTANQRSRHESREKPSREFVEYSTGYLFLHLCLHVSDIFSITWSTHSSMSYSNALILRGILDSWRGRRVAKYLKRLHMRHPRQLSLAIPPWIRAMSTGDSWGVNTHPVMWRTGLRVSQC